MTTATKLTGSALIAKAQELDHLTKSEQIIACGYVRENGTPCFTEFYENLLTAKGITLGDIEPKAPKADGEETFYSVYIPVTTSYQVIIEGPAGMSREQVLEAVTKDDLALAEHCDGDVWHQLKHFDADDVLVEDEDCEEVR